MRRGLLLLGAILLGLSGAAQARVAAAGNAAPAQASRIATAGQALLHASGITIRPARLTLITTQGQPVGGEWQRWVDEMRVSTVSGTLVFVPDGTACDGYPGCSVPATNECVPVCPTDGPYAPAITYVAPGSGARAALYFELGHQFDWRLLTPADRRWFAWNMRLRGWPWWASGGPDGGLTALFASYYQDCAFGVNDVGSGLSLLAPAGFDGPLPPTSYERVNACTRIDKVGDRAHGIV